MSENKSGGFFGILGVIYLLAAACGTFYLFFADLWVAHAVTHWQAWLLRGRYYPVLTLFVTFIILMLPIIALAVLTVLFNKIRGK